MADAAVDFLLDNLKQLLVYQSDLITDIRSHIENLERDLRVSKAFLRDTVKMRKKNERTKEIGKEIHDVVYEVEDIIDDFVTKTIEKRSKSKFSNIWRKSTNLDSIRAKVEAIKEKVESARREMDIVSVYDELDNEKPEPRPPRAKGVVGFEDVTEGIISRLIQETDHFDVISLIGTYGLGKTTVAWKIFNDPRIVYRFPIRIWLTISQQFTEKEIFLSILKDLTTINDDIYAKKDDEIAELITAHLQTGSFLIVLDDVWTRADWERLRIALPYNAKGKVLITSRNEDMGKYASSPLPIFQLRFFTFEESWKLFRLEALHTLDCPHELIAVGQNIAENCGGLPLAIVVIGGILATMFSPSNITATIRAWEKVSTDMSSHLSEKHPANRIQKLISLSYDKLPFHLRACFLYLGLFPQDFEIPVSKLIRMWIGEGFIQQNSDCSLEETGEKYLEDLINRNLVKSVKFKPDGKVKICQIHDILRDFCRTEAGAENFLQEIKFNKDGQCVPSPSDIEMHRRLSIHSNCLNFTSLKPFGPRVRSFVCFPKDKYVVTPENSTKIIGALKLLRVLDVLPFKFTTIDSDMYNLVHMRYMALSSEMSILPSDFSKLSNIQTLIVETTSRTLEVRADIWKMNHLRHLKTNASAVLPKSTRKDKPSAELQTLGTISVESCTEELSDLACNLKKLGIRGKLALLFDTRKGSFDSLRKMKHLQKLKLINDAYPRPLEEERLHSLPAYDRFPSGLTSLTLCATFLSWDHMPTLGLLQKLKVLKLKDHAFMGSTWEAVDRGFQCLEFLYIEKTDLSVWNASSQQYPKLRGLVLRNCEKLLKIPIELAHIKSFHKLELHTCISAAKSAREIWDAKKKTQAEGFMLSIYASY